MVPGIILSLSILPYVDVNYSDSTKTNDISQSTSYTNSNLKIQAILLSHQIAMSSPVKLDTQDLIEQYCLSFIAEKARDIIDYCTSTELKTSNGDFFGNIHMVGSTNSPDLIIGTIQIDPFFNQEKEANAVFTSMLLTLVCDCWEDKKPSNFDSLTSFLDSVKEMHLETLKPRTVSQVITLEDKQIQTILITNQQGYEWQFLINNNDLDV